MIKNIKKKIDEAFDNMWGESPFYKAISEWEKKGVEWHEIDNTKLHAIARHNNQYEYPEKRYVMKMDDKGAVKYFEISHRNSDWMSDAQEITEEDFAMAVIPAETNPALDIRDKKDRTAEQMKEVENIQPKQSEGEPLRKDNYPDPLATPPVAKAVKMPAADSSVKFK